MWLPNIYKVWNEKRGHGQKLKGLIILTLSFICYLAIAQLPIILMDFKTGMIQLSVIAFTAILMNLIVFKWIWGSGYWQHPRDTYNEHDLKWAEDHANMASGFSYNETTALMLTDPEIINWKHNAFKYLNSFKYYLGYSIISLATLNPLVILVGAAGKEIAEFYRVAFETENSTVLTRAETTSGEWIGRMHIIVVSILLVGNLIQYFCNFSILQFLISLF